MSQNKGGWNGKADWDNNNNKGAHSSEHRRVSRCLAKVGFGPSLQLQPFPSKSGTQNRIQLTKKRIYFSFFHFQISFFVIHTSQNQHIWRSNKVCLLLLFRHQFTMHLSFYFFTHVSLKDASGEWKRLPAGLSSCSNNCCFSLLFFVLSPDVTDWERTTVMSLYCFACYYCYKYSESRSLVH